MYSSLVFLFLCLSCISLIEAQGFGVELIHRDSSKSPFYLPSETHFQRVSNAIRRSINRVNHFEQRSFSTKNVKSDVISDLGEYLMSYSIGTPPFKVLGIVDTGSDIVWLQCKPCNPCYKQTTPIFDPSKSTTYKTIPCTSDICQSVRDSSCSSNDQQSCQYIIHYGDNSKSEGDISLDVFTLYSTKGSPVSFPKTVIGCGHSNIGTFRREGSGIVGLANGPLSLISQLGSSIQGKFSYCLVPALPSNNSSASSKLNFGDDALVSGGGTVSTPMILDNIFYYLSLEGFSVGNKRVEFGGSSSSGDGKGNIIIDSGTTLTILPDDVYSELESAVAAEVKLERTDDPNQFLNLCYKSPVGEKLDVPLITAHFRGADVQLNALNTFVQVSEDVVCFAFRSDSRLSIFGNLAQQNILVGYDLQNKVISFKPTDCTSID
ncbi:hypothetical protein RIF29_13671 [Crotalaria pallida]|uniref:Peptidase A1 domain-containing protein n=1 Tax=Crotalaria pallida TaxID=3830 RepID=A0AAN9P2H0_CROPI